MVEVLTFRRCIRSGLNEDNAGCQHPLIQPFSNTEVSGQGVLDVSQNTHFNTCFGHFQELLLLQELPRDNHICLQEVV